MISRELNLIIQLAKTQSIMSRRFDTVGNGLGFTDFVILGYLYDAENNKLRRIDLAERLGLTASGVTKLLLPMEKIGLVARESNPRDARVSLVTLAPGGKQLYEYSIEKAEYLAETVFTDVCPEDIERATDLLKNMRRLSSQ